MATLPKLVRHETRRNASHAANTPLQNEPKSFAGFKSQRFDTSGSLRSLFRRRQKRVAEVTTTSQSDSTAASNPASTPASTEVWELALAFVNTLNSSRVSDFLAWFLHYDVVELPESPAAWYARIDAMEMRGWIALGTYLKENTNYGMDIVVLDSICDRLNLRRQTVRDCAIQLSDPQKMAWTQLASTVAQSQTLYKVEVERLEYIRAKLYGLHAMARRIKPTSASIFEAWRTESEERLRGYLTDVVAKRIEYHKVGPSPTGIPNCTQVSRDIEEALRLNYLYEAMQQERQVPLVRYGLFPDLPKAHLVPASGTSCDDTSAVPIVQESFIAAECQLERSFSIAKLRSENRYLRGKTDQLRRTSEALADSNAKLVEKLAALGRNPALFVRPDWSTTPAPGPVSHEYSSRSRSLLLQVPEPHARPRSLSDGAAQEYPSLLKQTKYQTYTPIASQMPLSHSADNAALELRAKQGLQVPYPTPDSVPPPAHDPHSSTPYKDVFAAFNEKKLPPLPLLHPDTGEPLTSPDMPCPAFRPPRAPGRIRIQRPCTPTPTGRQEKRRSFRIKPLLPETPPRESAARKSMFVSESSNTATNACSQTSSTITLPEATTMSQSTSGVGSEVPKKASSVFPRAVTPSPQKSLAGSNGHSANIDYVRTINDTRCRITLAAGDNEEPS